MSASANDAYFGGWSYVVNPGIGYPGFATYTVPASLSVAGHSTTYPPITCYDEKTNSFYIMFSDAADETWTYMYKYNTNLRRWDMDGVKNDNYVSMTNAPDGGVLIGFAEGNIEKLGGGDGRNNFKHITKEFDFGTSLRKKLYKIKISGRGSVALWAAFDGASFTQLSTTDGSNYIFDCSKTAFEDVQLKVVGQSSCYIDKVLFVYRTIGNTDGNV